MGHKKVILITGASSGIGKESAKELLKQGHTVYTAARRLENMKDLEKLGGHPIHLDISKFESIENLVKTIFTKEDRIDVLWNNAGFGLFGSIEDVKIEDARYQFEVNLFGLARLTQLIIPSMRNQKSGTIINTSSMGGKVYTPLGAWYHATKHALEGWSDCLRLEVAPFGINVVVLEPGAIQTEFGNPMVDSLKKNANGSSYQDLTTALVGAAEKSFLKPGHVSKPKVIANTITKIVNSKKPKTRYLVGKYAKPMVFIRKYFGDRIYDKIVMGTFKSLMK
jgi:short-subunit dehydrogenase